MSAIRTAVRSAIGPLTIDESYIAYRVLSRSTQGVMLDLGAHFGSSLAPFAADGWMVHAFEPDPSNRARLEAVYDAWPNVLIVPEAVSDAPGELPLYVSSESTGISSLAPFRESHTAEATVPVTTLADYVAAKDIRAIDFLKIDVEGFERNVLRGHNWSVRPRVVVAEFEDSKTVPLGYSWQDLADELVAAGYRILVSEWRPIVRYGAAHTWNRFAEYPADLADAAAWGNLIAVEPELWGRTLRLAARSRRNQRAVRLARRLRQFGRRVVGRD